MFPGFLTAHKLASHWNPARRRIVEQAYVNGSPLDGTGMLKSSGPLGDRATEPAYAHSWPGCRTASPCEPRHDGRRPAPHADGLEPGRDWTGLAWACNRLKETATPSRDKLSCMVAASDLLDLGIGLMDTATVARMRRTK